MAAERKRRIWLRSAIVAFILIFAWIGVMIALQTLRDEGHDFSTETRAVLERIRDGRAEEVYEDASPRFRELIIKDRFVELAGDINQTLGGFRDVIATKEVEHIRGPGGETGRLEARLAFDRGKTTGQFSYHLVDGSWRLMGMSVDIPAELASTTPSPETQGARFEAPAEVIAMVREVLERDRDAQGGEIYEQASPPFQQSISSKQIFLEMLAARRSALGSYVRVLDFLQSAQNPDQTKAKVAAVVEYEKAKTTATFEFIKDDKGQWRLLTYKVVIPEPRIPTLSGPAPSAQ